MNLEFLALVHKWALTSESTGRLIGFEADDARFSFKDDSFLVLLHCLPGREILLREKVKHFGRVHSRGVLHLVVLGDDASFQEILTKLENQSTSKCRFYCYQLNPAGEVWAGPHSDIETDIGKTLSWISSQTTIQLPEPGQLQLQIQQQLSQSQKEARELDEFQKRYQTEIPYLTYSVAAVLALVFLAEGYFGGTTSMSVLTRMGANIPELIQKGEWWRLLSAAFLHSGLLHAGCNIYVLVALGKFVEQLIGGARLMSLLVLSAFGGSLASMLSSPNPSVGASGALWGLFGAAGALAFWPRGVIPTILVPRLKRSIFINLGINLLISLAPQIDMAAHLGGGAVGAVLAGSGILFLGREASQESGKLKSTVTWKALALFLAAVSVASLGLAQYHGKPWALERPWHWKSVSIADGKLQLEIPSHFSIRTDSVQGDRREYVFGDFGRDGFVVLVAPGKRETKGDLRSEVEQAVEIKRSLPLAKGATRFDGPRLITEAELSNHQGIYEGYDVGARLRVHSSLLWYGDWLVRLEWVSSNEDSDSLAVLWRIAESLRLSQNNGSTPKE